MKIDGLEVNIEKGKITSGTIQKEGEETYIKDAVVQVEEGTLEVINGIKSKERVKQHGEVFTPEHIVLDMIALIPEETRTDINSTWLEPACGNGNFLVEILKLKLNLAEELPKDDYDLNVIKSVCTIYGIDIQSDNVNESKQRMRQIIADKYKDYTGKIISDNLMLQIDYVLDINIIYGDAIKEIFMITGEKLRFSEWKFKGTKVTRVENDIESVADKGEKSQEQLQMEMMQEITGNTSEKIYETVEYTEIYKIAGSIDTKRKKSKRASKSRVEDEVIF